MTVGDTAMVRWGDGYRLALLVERRDGGWRVQFYAVGKLTDYIITVADRDVMEV